MFTGDSSTLNSAPAGTITAMLTGSPSANHSIMYNGSQWVPTLMEGRLLALNVYTSQNGTHDSYTSSGSGTWTKPSGCSNVLVYVTGGGGKCKNQYR